MMYFPFQIHWFRYFNSCLNIQSTKWGFISATGWE